MRNIKRMQIPKPFENSQGYLLNGKQTQVLSILLTKMIISIGSDMDITNRIWQEVSHNIQEVFPIILPPQKMVLQLNDICTLILHFNFLQGRHFPLLILPVIKQPLDSHSP